MYFVSLTRCGHCYGGLAKRAEIEPPVLPEIGDLKQQNTEHQVV